MKVDNAMREFGTGKGRGARSVKRREALIRAACDVFLEDGYMGASVADIVKRAGGSKTNVYTNFGDKKGLFVAAVEALCSEVVTPLAEPDYSRLDLETSLRKFGEVLLKLILQKRSIALQRLIVSEAGRFPEVGDVWYKHGPHRSHVICAEIIAAHAARLGCDRATAVRTAVLFHDMLLYDVQHRRLAGLDVSATAVREKVDEAVQMLLRSLQDGVLTPQGKLRRANRAGRSAISRD